MQAKLVQKCLNNGFTNGPPYVFCLRVMYMLYAGLVLITAPQLKNKLWWGKNILRRGANERLGGIYKI